MHPMRPFLFGLLAACGSAAAQFRVIPASVEHRDANDVSSYPFHLKNCRLQQVVDGDLLTNLPKAVIVGVSYRRDMGGTIGAYPIAAATVPRLTVTLSYSAKTVQTMSSKFADNRGGGETVVFDGQLQLPYQPIFPGVGPFNADIQFTRPFIYEKTNGDLLLESVAQSPVSGHNGYWIDAWERQTYGPRWWHGVSGALSDSTRPSWQIASTSSIIPGGHIRYDTGRLQRQLPAAWFIGFSPRVWGSIPLPFDLGPAGASGNAVYTGMDIVGPLPVVQVTGGWAGQASLPLPGIQDVGGLEICAQAIFFDATANPLGLVFTNMMRTEVGGGPYWTQSVGSSDLKATSGLLPFTPGGPVLRLRGAL